MCITRIILCFMMIGLAIGFCKSQSKSRPNIIIFFTDDQGYADVGCYGANGFKTPNLDKLASEGIKFTTFYVAATVCTPSRASLLTGKYSKRVGLEETVLFPYSNQGLSPELYNMARMLKEKGYSTSCIGKWHLGHQQEYMPNNHGFDNFYGVPYSNDMDSHYYREQHYKAPPLPFYHNEEVIETGADQRYLTKRYTREAVRQIKGRNMDKPFFIYLAHNMPHTPLHVSEAFDGRSKRGLYGDVIMELDWSAGEIVKALKEEEIYDNTIFLFTSDNGPHIGSAKPLRGKKAQTWEGGQRVPAIMVWPNEIPAGKVCNEVVSTLDLLPTFAEISGATIPDDVIMDGIDISKLLKRPEDTKLPERPIYFYALNGELEAVRLGKWKLHIKKSNGWNRIRNGIFPISLYNLKKDMSETNNVAKEHPEQVEKLAGLIQKFQMEF